MIDQVVASEAFQGRHYYGGARFARDLERRLENATCPSERARVADQLATVYANAGDVDGAAAVLDQVGWIADVELRGPLEALRGVIAAMNGESAAEIVEAAVELVDQVSEPTAAVVLQRLGAAMYFNRDTLAAEKYSLSALDLAEKLENRWLMARAAAVLYGVNAHLTWDYGEAWHYAEVATTEANAAEDRFMFRASSIAQLELAVTQGQWELAERLRAPLRRDRFRGSPDSEASLHVAEALLHGHAEDFLAMSGRLDAALTAGLRLCSASLARAMRALALAGAGADSEARDEARRAFGLAITNGVPEHNLAHLKPRRMLAGVLASFVLMLIGDASRGGRELRARSSGEGPTGLLARALDIAARGGRNDLDDPYLRPARGYIEITQRVMACRGRRQASVPAATAQFTRTELEIGHALVQGKTNLAIAAERGVSCNAIERYCVRIYRKFGVKKRAQAVSKLADVFRTALIVEDRP